MSKQPVPIARWQSVDVDRLVVDAGYTPANQYPGQNDGPSPAEAFNFSLPLCESAPRNEISSLLVGVPRENTRAGRRPRRRRCR